MGRHYITAIEAETLARLFYKLPPRNHRGRPLRNQHMVYQSLQRKRLIIGKYPTEKGLRELRSYCRTKLEKRA